MAAQEHPLYPHYTRLWETALAQFRQNAFELDPQLHNPADDRRGLTVLARPDVSVVGRIHDFLAGAQQLAPEQYVYHPAEIHLTVLTIILCHPGFQLDRLPIDTYCALIRDAIRPVPPLSIRFQGITASPSCIMIQGFPQTDHLEQLRNNLRTVFKQSSLEHTIDSRYKIFTAHSTVIRFARPVQRPAALLDYLHRYRDCVFGVSPIDAVELVVNDWFHRRAVTYPLERFPLDG
jgi:2'-5' RNA ligase